MINSINRISSAADSLPIADLPSSAAGKLNTALQNKLDKAYTELRELATKTVESASGVKIIGSAGE